MRKSVRTNLTLKLTEPWWPSSLANNHGVILVPCSRSRVPTRVLLFFFVILVAGRFEQDSAINLAN